MLALIFPGQGSQIIGMGKEFYNSYPAARNIFEQASEQLKWDVADVCFNSSEEKLAQTNLTQPVLLTVEIAILEAVKREFALPITFSAGHSLGEYSALISAGAISFQDALRVVHKRGQLMYEASTKDEGMMALTGVSISEVEQICSELRASGTSIIIACYNSPEQVVVSGNNIALDAVIQALARSNAKHVRLNVGAAFHTPSLHFCAETLKESLQTLAWQVPNHAFLSNVLGCPYPQDVREWPALLSRQITQPVRWMQCIRFLYSRNVTHMLEIGPGQVLTRLNKAIMPNIQNCTISHPDDLEPAQRMISNIQPSVISFAFIGRCLAFAAATRNHDPKKMSFEEHCHRPYVEVMRLYQSLQQGFKQVDEQGCRQALEMLTAVMDFKGISIAEQDIRLQELSWFDRFHLIEAKMPKQTML